MVLKKKFKMIYITKVTLLFPLCPVYPIPSQKSTTVTSIFLNSLEVTASSPLTGLNFGQNAQGRERGHNGPGLCSYTGWGVGS